MYSSKAYRCILKYIFLTAILCLVSDLVIADDVDDLAAIIKSSTTRISMNGREIKVKEGDQSIARLTEAFKSRVLHKSKWGTIDELDIRFRVSPHTDEKLWAFTVEFLRQFGLNQPISQTNPTKIIPAACMNPKGSVIIAYHSHQQEFSLAGSPAIKYEGIANYWSFVAGPEAMHIKFKFPK